MGAIIIERERIGDAAARKGQAVLALEIGNFLGQPEAQRMWLAVEEPGIEQAGHVLGRDRAIGDAAGRRFHLDQRLQPEQAARAVAHDRRIDLSRRELARDGAVDLLGPDRKRRGVAGNVDLDRHRRFRAPSISRSAAAGETRP